MKDKTEYSDLVKAIDFIHKMLPMTPYGSLLNHDADEFIHQMYAKYTNIAEHGNALDYK